MTLYYIYFSRFEIALHVTKFWKVSTMATERKIIFWTILSTIHWMNSCTSQTLYSDSDTCSGLDEIKTLKVLQQLVSNQAIKTEKLEKKLNSVEGALSKLNQSKIDQDIKTEMLEKKLHSVEVALSNLNQSKIDQDIETEMLEKELNSVKETHLTLMPDHVAFHVVANNSFGPGVIIFDHVISNIESGYDINSGIFSAPTTGFYVFSWSIETYGQLTEAALLVNGLEMGITKSDEALTYYDTSTSFAVLNLTIKDKVWIKVKSGRAEAMHSMFSGWMISKKDTTAFFVSLSSKDRYGTIIFDNENLDTDDAYSTTTGKFVAPRSGLYVFMVSGLTIGDSGYICRFSFSNGISKPHVSVSSTSQTYDSSSYMTFAWMNSGESVHIESGRMMASTMFAGWQLMNDTNVSKSSFPAFLAHTSVSSSSTPVVYDKSHGGYHNGYSTSTGVFTADRDGLYLFLYNTEAFTRVTVTALRVNGVEIFETRSDGRRTDFDDTSAVTVLQLSSNDRVSIGVKSGTVDDGESLFFGILLFEI